MWTDYPEETGLRISKNGGGKFYPIPGVSGMGGLIEFDPVPGEYRVRKMPELTEWSGSSMKLDGPVERIGLVGVWERVTDRQGAPADNRRTGLEDGGGDGRGQKPRLDRK